MAVKKGSAQNRPEDPTPEEIEERAAWCRAQRSDYAKSIEERAGRERWELPNYSYSPTTRSFVSLNT